MEAVGEARNRAQAKRRKARTPWVEQVLSCEARYLLVGRVYWRRGSCEALRSYPERSAGLRGQPR